MPAHPIQPGFVAGELSPQLYGREDFQKYAFGAELIRNAVVKPGGRLHSLWRARQACLLLRPQNLWHRL